MPSASTPAQRCRCISASSRSTTSAAFASISGKPYRSTNHGAADMASGIQEQVVILGMGCSRFGERWDAEPADLMSEAFEECIRDAGIDRKQIEAAWQATAV